MDAFFAAAIEEARKGLAEGGIPIGSVIVHDGQIIGRGHNRRHGNSRNSGPKILGNHGLTFLDLSDGFYVPLRGIRTVRDWR